MSYIYIMEYEIVPKETYKIKRVCAGCGGKQFFECKEKFRVNANGNRVDVWLIYGCEKCGHTYHLPIYERVKMDRISKMEYQEFLENDVDTVFRYGTDKSIFGKNRAEIAWELAKFELVTMGKNKPEFVNTPILVNLYNPYGIPVRKDKVLSKILQISRSKVIELINEGELFVNEIKESGGERSNDSDYKN